MRRRINHASCYCDGGRPTAGVDRQSQQTTYLVLWMKGNGTERVGIGGSKSVM